MNRYTIYNRTSGALFGECLASTIEAALDAIAQDQGYSDYAALCGVVGISVEDGRADLYVWAFATDEAPRGTYRSREWWG